MRIFFCLDRISDQKGHLLRSTKLSQAVFAAAHVANASSSHEPAIDSSCLSAYEAIGNKARDYPSCWFVCLFVCLLVQLSTEGGIGSDTSSMISELRSLDGMPSNQGAAPASPSPTSVGSDTYGAADTAGSRKWTTNEQKGKIKHHS